MFARIGFPVWVLLGVAGLLGCAGTKGPAYPDYVTQLEPVAAGDVRVMLLRPNDRYDDYRGSPAKLRVNGDPVGDLGYGSFLSVDVAAGTVDLWTSARDPIRSPFIKSCELQLIVSPGMTIYVDVAPRNASIAAGLIGMVVGMAAVPGQSVYGMHEVGKAVFVDPVVTGLAGDAGAAVAQVVESAGKPCGGHFRMQLLDEQEALARLEKLHLAQAK